MPKDGEITLDEWMAELERLGKSKDDEGMSTEEIAHAIGQSTKFVRQNLLRPGLNAGRIEVGHRRGTRIDGQPCRIPVYRFVRKGRNRGRPNHPIRTSRPHRRRASTPQGKAS